MIINSAETCGENSFEPRKSPSSNSCAYLNGQRRIYHLTDAISQGSILRHRKNTKIVHQSVYRNSWTVSPQALQNDECPGTPSVVARTGHQIRNVDEFGLIQGRMIPSPL